MSPTFPSESTPLLPHQHSSRASIRPSPLQRTQSAPRVVFASQRPPLAREPSTHSPAHTHAHAYAHAHIPVQPSLTHHSLPATPMHSSAALDSVDDLPVYTNIHRIRRDIVSVVEDYISAEQLRDVRLNIAVVRPLVDQLHDLDDISIVYCLLVNRAQFLLEDANHTNRHNVHFTRATLCELIATRILRRFHDRDDGADSAAGLLLISHILVTGFAPFQNAPADIQGQAMRMHRGTVWAAHHHRTLPALEIAILTESKFFLSSTPCQKVVHAIYEGRIVYTPSSFVELIPDHYKRKPIHLYDPRNAPLLNQYRLIVPRTRNALEIAHFLMLLVLYLAVMMESGARNVRRLGWLEALFAFYSFGWALDQFATIMSHGWHVYTQNLWSFLDVGFTAIYLAYLTLRLHGWRIGSDAPALQAFDVLALGALVLVPRLAFNLLSDNLVFLSLRSMMADFSLLTALSAWCFFGFLLSLLWLGNGNHMPLTISKWMLWIWFGLDGTGIQRSGEFHWLLGPSVMVAFAFLGNTLFLTILVSMLSNTFSTIASNATQEICYRRAVLTLEAVKSDALFAYMPPFNIFAVFVFFPLKFVLSPRWFHKIHVASVRFVNLPLLLVIALAERRMLWQHNDHSTHHEQVDMPAQRPDTDSASSTPPSLRPRRVHVRRHRRAEPWWSWFWPQWSSHRDIRSVFDLPPPDEVHDEIAVDDELTHHLIRRQFTRMNTVELAAQSMSAKAGSAQPTMPLPLPTTQVVTPAAGPLASPPGRPAPSPTPGAMRTTSDVTRKNRRDSMFPGISHKLRGSFGESDDDNHNASSNEVNTRLGNLEAAVARIEAMMTRLMPDDGASEAMAGVRTLSEALTEGKSDEGETCSASSLRDMESSDGDGENDELIRPT